MQDSSDFRFLVFSFSFDYWVGASSFEDPAKRRLPVLVMTTVPALATLGANFASHPVTVISSPAFNESLRQPFRIKPLGLPISKSQFTTTPFASLEST